MIRALFLFALLALFFVTKAQKASLSNTQKGNGRQLPLIPLPQKVQRQSGYFSFAACKAIVVNNPELATEAKRLKEELAKRGLTLLPQPKHEAKREKAVVLRLGNVSAPLLSEEAYRLEVTPNNVTITANTPHGIFNGIQTLLQLSEDSKRIAACVVTDWPAFGWRGYMIDVGRNYVSMNLLKEQIDVMARYKLNVFHFHPTEDMAWRIESKLYPQLTSPETMLRNKGKFYSEAEIKELIAYCKKRHITFVPEIDMPGHSAAFRRAMKTDMQSDSGTIFVKNILKEFCTTYGVPYLHIGADEVKITNKDFVPVITAYIESFGKKAIGWQPGANFTNHTVRQLWMDDNGRITSNNHLQYIDSRHLYLNHMDPLESVVTIYNRQIGNRPQGSHSARGGTICTWNDRAVAKEEDVLRMNPVYPAMLAFAERMWRGGGQAGWVANVSDGDTKAFAKFENRLLEQKRRYFKDKPFPYTAQSQTVWRLYGPYKNEGDGAKKFAPESREFDSSRFYKEVTGGTIVLRHWWAPLIKGAIEQPKDSTTWYAVTKLWYNEEGEKSFWIGFNNLSRSTATDPPPVAAWDDKGSAVWVNDKLIAPPDWKRGGRKGDSEIPLMDEGYEYREPTKIFMKKGWNTVLIKAPVESFKGRDWQNPVKWMFTFVRASLEK